MLLGVETAPKWQGLLKTLGWITIKNLTHTAAEKYQRRTCVRNRGAACRLHCATPYTSFTGQNLRQYKKDDHGNGVYLRMRCSLYSIFISSYSRLMVTTSCRIFCKNGKNLWSTDLLCMHLIMCRKGADIKQREDIELIKGSTSPLLWCIAILHSLTAWKRWSALPRRLNLEKASFSSKQTYQISWTILCRLNISQPGRKQHT